MVRYLKFPRKKFVDIAHERKVRRSILVFSLIIIIPSIFMGVNVIREASFDSQAIKFVADIERSPACENVQIVGTKRNYSAKEQSITISLVGQPLTPEQVEYLHKRLADFGLSKAKLTIRQTGGATLDLDAQSEMIQQILERKEEQLAARDATIDALHAQIDSLQNQSAITPEQLVREVQVLFPDVLSLTFAQAEEIDTRTQTKRAVPVVNATWRGKQSKQYAQFETWLRARLNTDDIKIVNQESPRK